MSVPTELQELLVDAPPDLGRLVVAAVGAAVLAPEGEPWRRRWEDDLIDPLAEAGELSRPEPGWLAPR